LDTGFLQEKYTSGGKCYQLGLSPDPSNTIAADPQMTGFANDSAA
jgi:hypothetical protein